MQEEFETLHDSFTSFVDFIQSYLPSGIEEGFDIKSFLNETFKQDEVVQKLRGDYKFCKSENEMLRKRNSQLLKENYKLLKENYNLRPRLDITNNESEENSLKTNLDKEGEEPYILLGKDFPVWKIDEDPIDYEKF